MDQYYYTIIILNTCHVPNLDVLESEEAMLTIQRLSRKYLVCKYISVTCAL